MNARLEIRFAASAGGTSMRVGVQDPPWRVIRAFPQPNGSSLVHLHNVSGGVLAGDRLSLDIHAASGTTAQLTSTGATRLYRHREGAADSEQHTHIRVDSGAVLEYLPDMVIPFARARHAQRTSVALAHGATFFWWETIAPGRQAMGESFAFERLQVSTRMESPDRPLLLEDYVLEPGLRALDSLARLGGYTHLASFYAVQVGRPAADLRELESRLNEMAREESTPGCTIWGANALAADGVVVRGLSATSRDLPATLIRFWKTARLFLTGQEAVPPRKVR